MNGQAQAQMAAGTEVYEGVPFVKEIMRQMLHGQIITCPICLGEKGERAWICSDPCFRTYGQPGVDAAKNFFIVMGGKLGARTERNNGNGSGKTTTYSRKPAARIEPDRFKTLVDACAGTIAEKGDLSDKEMIEDLRPVFPDVDRSVVEKAFYKAKNAIAADNENRAKREAMFARAQKAVAEYRELYPDAALRPYGDAASKILEVLKPETAHSMLMKVLADVQAVIDEENKSRLWAECVRTAEIFVPVFTNQNADQIAQEINAEAAEELPHKMLVAAIHQRLNTLAQYEAARRAAMSPIGRPRIVQKEEFREDRKNGGRIGKEKGKKGKAWRQ